MEPEGSLPHSQVLFTCPYPEPARSSPHPHIFLIKYPTYKARARGTTGIASPILPLGIRWRWVVRFTLRSVLSWGKKTSIQWTRGSRLCGSRSGLSSTEKEKSLPDTGNRSPIILVDVTTLADRNVTPVVAEKKNTRIYVQRCHECGM